jgi:hypothetical protein
MEILYDLIMVKFVFFSPYTFSAQPVQLQIAMGGDG